MLETNTTAASPGTLPAATPRKPCVRWGCISLTIIVVLCVIGIFVLRQQIRCNLTPEQWVQVRAMETEVITLPKEWHKPASLPAPEIVAFWNAFEKQSKIIRETHEALLIGTQDILSSLALLEQAGSDVSLVLPDQQSTAALFKRMGTNGPPVLPEQVTSYTALLADLQPLLDETSRTVSLPSFTTEIDLYTSGMINFFEIQTFAKLGSIVARQRAVEGNCFEAVETASLPIRLVERTEQANAITHLIAVAVTVISTNALYSIADTCTDTLALDRGLHIMNDLRSIAFPGNYKLWRYGDSVGALRFAAAHGYPVNLSPQTLASYYSQSYWLYMPHYFRWIIDNLPPTDRRVAAAKERLELIKEWDENEWTKEPPFSHNDFIHSNPSLHHLASFALGVDPYVLTYVTGSLNFLEMETRTETAMALYDLTRLRYAQRLAELKGLPAPTAYEDPFTSASFPFSASKQTYYSVGPDKKDNNIELLYDATNGTVSPGDLLVR